MSQNADTQFTDPYFDQLAEKYGPLTRKHVHVISSYKLPDDRTLIRLGPECHIILKAESRNSHRRNWFGRIATKLARRLYRAQLDGPWPPPVGATPHRESIPEPDQEATSEGEAP